MDTKGKGDQTEGIVLAALLCLGKSVLLPFGENHRYDLVVEDGERFLRVQCKTGRLRDGVIKFNTASTHGHRGGARVSYRGQVDLFGVYCPDTGKTYFVPVMDVGAAEGYLRVDPARSGRKKGVKYAADFEMKLPS